MRCLLTILTVLIFAGSWSQSADDNVKVIEKLRSTGKLIAKSSVDKTFAGSVTAYYDKDSLVLISSLTDAEAGGTETVYFLQRGVLTKAFIMESTFNSSEEWAGYYSKHSSAAECYACHGKKSCIVTEFTFGEKPTVVRTESRKRRELSVGEKDELMRTLMHTFDELKILTKEFH